MRSPKSCSECEIKNGHVQSLILGGKSEDADVEHSVWICSSIYDIKRQNRGIFDKPIVLRKQNCAIKRQIDASLTNLLYFENSLVQSVKNKKEWFCSIIQAKNHRNPSFIDEASAF